MFNKQKLFWQTQLLFAWLLIGKLHRRRFLGLSALGLAGVSTLTDVLSNLVNAQETAPVEPVNKPIGRQPADGPVKHKVQTQGYQPSFAPAALNPIQTENQLPGDSLYLDLISNDHYDSGGKLTTSPTWDEIRGYPSAPSVNKGGSINLHVSVYNGKSFFLEVYRVGWYNGMGARRVLPPHGDTTTQILTPAQSRSVPAPDPVTGLVECNWPASYPLSIPNTWVSGHYIAKITINDVTSKAYQNYVHFVVRDDAYNSKLLFKSSVTTYHAYNNFGGKSLYGYNCTNGVQASKVSFDRPYAGDGAGDFFFWEISMLQFLEKEGYDVSYATSLDLHTNQLLCMNHQAVLSDGHDEYWTSEMFDNTIAARDWGVHLAFFGANPCYWQIRLETSTSGTPNRVIVGYKENATLADPNKNDPYYRQVPPSPYTTCLFRDNRAANRPENQLLGIMYDNYSDWDKGVPYVVQNADHWIYTGQGVSSSPNATSGPTGFSNGTSVPDIVGYEWDSDKANGFAPAGLVKLSASPATGYRFDNTGKGFHDVATTANSSIYQATSGAWVFASGTVYWAYGCLYTGYQSKDLHNAGIQQTTRNLLNKFVDSASYHISPAVSLNADDGTGTKFGTLSYALNYIKNNPNSPRSIRIVLSNGDNTIRVSGKLPVMPDGVTLDGGTCGPAGPLVVLDGTNSDAGADGLLLHNQDVVRNLKITHFKGRQIAVAPNATGGNSLRCVVATK